MSFPLAYLLTWTTYGTWLPGDERTSVTHGNNRYATPYSAPSDRIRMSAVRSMNHEPVVLSRAMRGVVDQTIRDHCDVRGWRVIAINVRSNHVHAVVSGGVEPETILSQLKAWSTRRLREADLIGPNRRVWTKHGSTRYLWDERSAGAAGVYVRDHQDGTRFPPPNRAGSASDQGESP